MNIIQLYLGDYNCYISHIQDQTFSMVLHDTPLELFFFLLLFSASQVPDAAQELSNIQGILSKYDFEAQSTEVSGPERQIFVANVKGHPP